MLTKEALADRKWGPYLEIRKAYEDVPVDWWDGGNSNSYGFINGLIDFVEITNVITKDPAGLGRLDPDGVSRDIAMLRQRLAHYVHVFREVDARLGDIE